MSKLIIQLPCSQGDRIYIIDKLINDNKVTTYRFIETEMIDYKLTINNQFIFTTFKTLELADYNYNWFTDYDLAINEFKKLQKG